MSSDSLQPGFTFRSTYEIVRRIGDGGAGIVYEAKHLTLGNPVAIKVLFKHFASSREIRRRFLEEAQIQAQLRHPNLVGVFDIIEENGLAAMVMEYVGGPSLDQLIEEQHPVEQALGLKLALGLLAGLNFAHAQGIVHRDIKPENVLLAQVEGEWVPKLSDFGIAKVLAGDSRTTAGAKMGTVRYMAPEQVADASKVDARADVYSVGVTLFQLFTGELPFDSDNVFALMRMHESAPVPRPSALREDLLPAIEAVILKALEKDPAARFTSALQMADALREIDPSGPASLPPIAMGVPVGADTTPPPMPGSNPPPGASGPRDSIGSSGERRPVRRRRTRESLELDLDDRPLRPTTASPAAISGSLSAAAIEAAARAPKIDLGRWIRLLVVTTAALLLYQLFPTIHCLYEATHAQREGSENRAEFNPGGYSRLDPESAETLSRTDGVADALSVGAPICWRRAGYGRGHHPVFNLLLSLSFAGLLVLVVMDRLGLPRRSVPPIPVPAGPRPPPRPTGPARGTLDALEGQESLPRGRDAYFTLRARDLRRSDIPRLLVKAAVRSVDGEVVPLWSSARPIARLMTGVPGIEAIADIPFIVAFTDVQRALDRSGLLIEDADRLLTRVDYERQSVACALPIRD